MHLRRGKYKMKNNLIGIIFIISLAVISVLIGKRARANNKDYNRVFTIIKILDGEWSQPTIRISNQGFGIRIQGVDSYNPPPKPSGSEAISMILAFQLAPQKTREDFAKFKKVDKTWVALNKGSNPETVWTERNGNWIFDAFDKVTFASIKDFNRAYAGNGKLNKMAEGLFGSKVLVAIVKE